jgi:integration host factor subunit beta
MAKKTSQAESLVIAVLDEIAGALERGKRVELRGVGILTVKEKRERQGRNPHTGEALVIEPHRVVRFRASELLLARLIRPDNRRPERPKSDPRQLAFPIDGQPAEPAYGHTRLAPPRLARGRTTRRQGMIYEQGK